MPFLNCNEQCDQNDLCDILPKLHQELLNLEYKKTSLQKYRVLWKNVNMDYGTPSTRI